MQKETNNSSPFTLHFSLFFRLLVLFALPFALYSNGSAASLQGKVSEVLDGENFVMISQTHLLKVRLVAAAAPVASQSYYQIAKQHLSDLILNKVVAVRYTGFQEGHLAGQVVCDGMDVNAQMIRDGVAWYNATEAMNLTDVERGIYQASQDAARTERRGLWQDATPVSPWDYRKAQVIGATINATPRPASSTPTYSPLPKVRKPELSNENLLGRLIRYSAVAGATDSTPLSTSPSPDRWLRYQPADRHFSILFPSAGRHMRLPVQDLQGNELEVNYLIGPGETNLYLALWTKGPNGTATDDSTISDTINGLTEGVNSATRNLNGMWIEATPERSVTLNGYVGKQYALKVGPATGTVRILSKQIGAEREVFMLCVMNGPGSESDGANFFNSLKIASSKQ